MAVDRTKLYEQVWSIPGWRLAVLYGISDVGLAKTCRRYNIPRPPRGYWARVAAGQRVRKTPLPRPRHADEVIWVKGWNMTDEAVQALVEDSHKQPDHPAEVGTSMHPLVVASRVQLLAANADHDGLLATGPQALDVRVSAAVAERAISILDALVKRWELRGGTVGETRAGAASQSHFSIRPDSLAVQLAENLDEDKPLTDPARLTGRLCLHIVGGNEQQFRRRWSDTKSQRLERMLGAFVETLANALEVMRQDRLDAECIARQKERVRAIRKVLDRDSSREFYSRQDLMQNVHRWVDAQHVRGYLEDLKAAVDAGRFKPSNPEQFGNWFDWASCFADSIDPILQGPLPEGHQVRHQNVATAELDLTRATRTVVDGLAIPDTDTLYLVSLDAMRQAFDGGIAPSWNELTRVLESLGYDVSKRQEAKSWW